MKLFNSAKRYVKIKVNHLVSEQKHKLDIKILQLKEELILKYMMPQILQYIREIIISKGLNPDVLPAPKVVDERLTTRNKSINFYLDNPRWLKESFKDESKHLINKIRSLKTEASKAVVTVPVVEMPAIETSIVGAPVVIDTEGLLSSNVEKLLEPNREKVVEDKPVRCVRSRKKVVVAKEDFINEAPKKVVSKKSKSNK